MLSFNRFKSKLKGSEQQKQNIESTTTTTTTSNDGIGAHLYKNTITKKSLLQFKRIAIFGNKDGFLSNLLINVLSQYDSKVSMISITHPNNNNNSNNNNDNNNNNNNNSSNNITQILLEREEIDKITFKNISIANGDRDVLKNILKEIDIFVFCFEWCHFRDLYLEMTAIYNFCQHNNEITPKHIIVTSPIGVEDSEFTAKNGSMESIFNPIPTSFLFYSSLMQWLFTGPPSYNNNNNNISNSNNNNNNNNSYNTKSSKNNNEE